VASDADFGLVASTFEFQHIEIGAGGGGGGGSRTGRGGWGTCGSPASCRSAMPGGGEQAPLLSLLLRPRRLRLREAPPEAREHRERERPRTGVSGNEGGAMETASSNGS